MFPLSHWGLPGVSVSKESAYNKGDLGLIPGPETSLEKGMATHQYSCLENSMNRGAWQAIVHGSKRVSMTEQLPVTYLEASRSRREF